MGKKVLDLFAGSCSFTKVAKEMGFETFSTDIADLQGIDFAIDFMFLNIKNIVYHFGIPNIVWASPDCATWSKAAGNLHFDSKSLNPKTEKAEKAFLLIDKLFRDIDFLLKLNPDLKFYVENPVGKLQKYLQAGTLFNQIRCVTVTQCSYGRNVHKPTHIFTNDLDWTPLQRCKGGCDSKKVKNVGDGRLRYYERAKIAPLLCEEILKNNL